MTREDKELLLKDLCARLPYGVKTKYVNTFCKIKQIVFEEHSVSHLFTDDNFSLSINDIQVYKPYLRTMLDMNREELNKYVSLKERIETDFGNDFFDTVNSIDYLYSIHIDVHGLSPKRLALEAPEDMYR